MEQEIKKKIERKIIFITKRIVHEVIEDEGQVEIRNEIFPEEIIWMKSLPVIGLDLETNSLDPYAGQILLVILGNENTQFVIDAYTYNCKTLLEGFSDDKVYLTVNGKFDAKFVYAHYNKKIKKIYDCMIVEQRLVQGTGFSSSLQAIKQRRLGIIMNKDVRSEFISADPSQFIFKNRHIVYGADDICDLYIIREKQKEKIAERNQQFLVYGIEFPLVPILGAAEMEGFDINEDKWKENVQNNLDKKYKVEVELDLELRTLRDKYMDSSTRIAISGGKFDMNRQRGHSYTVGGLVQDTLFGELLGEIEINIEARTKKRKEETPYINYGSSSFLLNTLSLFDEPLPTVDQITGQPGPYVVPTFITSNGKKTIDKSLYKFTLGAGAVESYLIENPNSILKVFLEKLVEYRGYCNRINSFGEEFLSKYRSRHTGRYHTIYRQCFAVTSRLQSGDEDQGYFNSQNIPAEKEYRECFYWGTDYLITTDLSGAEAVIMIDKAHDEYFYELAIKKDDAHSPLATAVWRAIGQYRLDNNISRISHGKTPYQLSTIVISKTENKDMRTLFKNTTFASIYGCGINKYAKMLNISKEEAKIGLGIMKKLLPKTFSMVEKNERDALRDGYLILNQRTNSRIWYPKIIEARNNGWTLSPDDEHAIRNSARNAAIQGTQADMLKEIMVEIHREAERQDLYGRFHFALLAQIHDETVYRCNNTEALVEFIVDNQDIQNSSLSINNEGKLVEMVTISEFIKRWHIQVCNRYLNFITMNAEQSIGKTWTK